MTKDNCGHYISIIDGKQWYITGTCLPPEMPRKATKLEQNNFCPVCGFKLGHDNGSNHAAK